MTKRVILAVIAVFFAWAVMDFIIHGVLLAATYEATAELWRPMEEMKMPLMYFVTLVSAVAFVMIYELLISPKSVGVGLQFGITLGLAFGIGMGFGTYSVQAIPLSLAWTWFIGTLAETTVAGAIAGAIIKPPVA